MKELWCYRFSRCHLNKACLDWTEETKERRKAREVHGEETGAGGFSQMSKLIKGETEMEHRRHLDWC